MERGADEVIEHMLAEIRRVTGLDLGRTQHAALHRWRYANTPKQEGPTSLIDPAQRLAACGDWCLHGRVEAAYLSGLDAARQIGELL